jgi:serine/threonine-protein kinase
MIAETIGPYRVLGKLGGGGMGEVYRARDTKLNRDVALKILPEGFARDPDRRARFEREAQLLASLNHPHISGIYGVEEGRAADGTAIGALVLELVEGPTLADRIARGPIPLDEALPIARQIADALEAAHERGIVHRDLKPANITLRADGTVKVLDFGLAKALAPEGASAAAGGHSMSPTIAAPAMTEAGMILGTVAYMSPEQARGKDVDERTDIWAYGCVLFEMLTGRPAFDGESGPDMLARVIEREPDFARLPTGTPPSIVRLVRRALTKDRQMRLPDIAVARLEIADAMAGADATLVTRPARRDVLKWIAAGTAGAMAGGGATAWFVGGRSAARTQASLTISLPPGLELPRGPSAAISPDGRTVVYAASRGGVTRLYARPLDTFESRPLAGTEQARVPFFSPDGAWIAFFTEDRLKTVSLMTGIVRDLAAVGSRGTQSGAWGSRGTIVFTDANGLYRMSVEGDDLAPVMSTEQWALGTATYPSFLPDGERLLVSSAPPGQHSIDTADERTIDLLTLGTGERRTLVQGGTYPVYLRSGHVAFLRAGSVMVIPFDATRPDAAVIPVRVIDGVRTQFNGGGTFSCSDGGTCLYVPGSTGNDRTLVIADRNGNPMPVPARPRNYMNPRFSPDGNRILYWLEQTRCDIEYFDLKRNAPVRLTSEGDNHFPMWIAEDRIAYVSRKPGGGGYDGVSRSTRAAAGEDPIPGLRNLQRVSGLTRAPDGTFVFAPLGQLWVVGGSAGSEPRRLSPSRFQQTMPAFSPDGRWLAYVSDELDTFNVYVEPYPTTGERYPVSVSGGTEPVWERQGRELFFRNGDDLLVVALRTVPDFQPEPPRPLFSEPYFRDESRISYDVSPDGQTFVMLRGSEQEQAAAPIHVILDWFDRLKPLEPRPSS